MIWVVIGLMSIAVIGGLVWPLFAHGRAKRNDAAQATISPVDESDYLVAQLAELHNETDPDGDPDAAHAARLEARRRLLAEYRRRDQADKPAAAPDKIRSAAILIAGAAPLLAVLIYLGIGEPNYDIAARQAIEQRQAQAAEQQAAIASMPEEERRAMIENMVEGLAARLEENPDDVEGWRMLARSYAVLGRDEESAQALSRAVELFPENMNLRLAYAESLLALQPEGAGALSDEAVAAFEAVLAIDEDQPLALFVLGDAARMAGDVEKARRYWSALLSQMSDGSPEAVQMTEMIDALG